MNLLTFELMQQATGIPISKLRGSEIVNEFMNEINKQQEPELFHRYHLGEQDGQIIRLKALGLHQQDGTFEQLINAVIYMAAEQKNEITALKSAGKELFSIYMDMDGKGRPKAKVLEISIAWQNIMNLINEKP